MRVIDAPGHADDHAIFYLPQERALFTGDVILGEGTVVVAPPGGAMRPYQHTLQRLIDEFGDARTIFGGHGPPVEDPPAKIAEYIAHRKMREEQIVDRPARRLEDDTRPRARDLRTRASRALAGNGSADSRPS